ncbi:MAG: CPBP family intramembrane metalloprotease [Synechococcales cyanobacterium CRU_2_2]|nr:CPBP family intramembrane metalloprotease [Synechococcales cyanobacterium CRU_2_2]
MFKEVILFFAIWLLLWSPIAFVLGQRLQWAFPHPPTPEQKIPLVLSLYALAPPLLWVWARRSGQSLADFGWSWSPGFGFQVAAGLGLAISSLVLLWGLERLGGWIRFAFDREMLRRQTGSILLILLIAIAISAVEELLFRGFLTEALLSILGQVQGVDNRPLGSGWVVILAVGLANGVFALLHLPWDRWQNVVPQLPGLWLMGWVLSLACLQQGNLGLAIGLHGGWVWAIASLDTLQALKYTGQVPTWVTGVGGHVLAGIIGLVFLVAMGGFLWFAA